MSPGLDAVTASRMSLGLTAVILIVLFAACFRWPWR